MVILHKIHTKRNPQKRVRAILSILCSTIVLGITAVIVALAPKTKAQSLESGSQVEENSLLRYNLIVKYDGVDRSGVHSDDETIVKILSEDIEVSDKIPDGLIFQGFESTTSGGIGAVPRSGEGVCSGIVVNDSGSTITGDDPRIISDGDAPYFPGEEYNGLHYDASTRTVNFKVNSLEAGCKLVVGIVTKTPTLASTQNRMDFYNTAYAIEDTLLVRSNTVHAWIGQDITSPTHRVFYSYNGYVPTDAPAVPDIQKYATGATVDLFTVPDFANYTFSGWSVSSGGAVISDGSFVMPDSDVYLVGSFTQKPTPSTYTVTYTAYGFVPAGFIPPSTKSYEPGTVVTVHPAPSGEAYDGLDFHGWYPNTTTEDGKFVMPAGNITINGTFTPKAYKVNYEFEGAIIPPNAEELLPQTETHYKGDNVALAEAPSASGYRFISWYYEDEFTMPANDVTIYGEWMLEYGTFRPEISMEVVDKKDSYYQDEAVDFLITVTNTADFDIQNVSLLEQLPGAKFIGGDGYTVLNDDHALIQNIPANSSITIKAQFPVTENKTEHYTNEVVISSATSESRPGFSLDPDGNYSATAEFDTLEKPETPPTSTGTKILSVLITLIASTSIIGFFVIKNKSRR